MFCCYLTNRNSKTGNTTDCMDWFEVEIGGKQVFLGSLRGKAETNTCQERMKLDGWLSSSLFKEQFPDHYAEILNILPISHYMDRKLGPLNIAANLPDSIQIPSFGPCLSNSYMSGEEYAQPDSVKKLGFKTCDMVNHPLLEQSYYLDEYHKARLKEEFDIEPWSFDQCVGEAVIVPTGCPYQNRKNKILLLEPNSLLPFFVTKMAIHKISEAVKEIREFTSSDSTAASRL